jgi:hypothetical protein
MYNFSFRSHSFAALILSCWLANSCFGQIPTIEVSSLSRQAAQLGSTVELRANGGRLEELDALAFSQPGITGTLQTTAPRLLADEPTRTNIFSVAVAVDSPRGLCDVRAHGRFGLSNPRRLLLTSKAIVLAASEHSNIATPMEVPTESIINDRCLPQKRNFYHVALAAGEQLNCAAYSKQIDSKASLNMILLDAQERELARSRSIGDWPAEIQYAAKEPQEVFVVVHDFLYQGGDDFSYLFEAAIAKTDSPAALELNELLRPSNVHFRDTENTPNDSISSIQNVPFSLTSSFEAEPFQCDFVAKAQQPLSIRIRSSEVGELTDPSIVVYKLDANGNPGQVANQDDAPSLGGPAIRLRRTDPWLQWTAPEDATYRIVVIDNQSGSRVDDAMRFTLSVSEVQPGFRLLAYHPFPTNAPAASRPFGTQLLKGGTEPIQILAIREDGFGESIEIAVEGLPAGVTCPAMIMPAGTNDATLILRCSDDAAVWHGELKIVGRAKLGEKSIEAIAEAVTVAGAATTTKNAIRHRSTKQLLSAINAFDVAPILVELGDGSVIEIAQGAKAAIPIKATRREGGKAECTLRPQQLPPKATLGETKIPADQTNVTAELNVAADAPLGEYTFWMQNETKVKMRPNPQSLEREEAYLAKLKAALEAEPADEPKAKLNEAITAVTAAVEELKKQTAEQEFTVWLPTTPQRIRITPKP